MQDQMDRQLNLERIISKTEINLINPIDSNKRLLVLDLDNTLFDFGARRHVSLQETMRPGLFNFLEEVFKYYNIAIWSATNWHWVEIKLTELGILTNLKFNISFVLEKSSMLSFKSIKKGQVYEHLIKPLPLIWSKMRNFNERNTLHIDDLARNFVMNVKNGVRVNAFVYSQESRNDRELYYLSKYLAHVSSMDDLSTFDHTNWRDFYFKNLNN